MSSIASSKSIYPVPVAKPSRSVGVEPARARAEVRDQEPAEDASIAGALTSFLLLAACGTASLIITAYFAARLISQLMSFTVFDFIHAVSGVG